MYNTIFLDAGHGGINPVTQAYTTAPSKMYTHKKEYTNGKHVFYEGVKNRMYVDIIAQKLSNKGINVVKVYHPYKDTTLYNRVMTANVYHDRIGKGFYCSEHSNATSSGKARGMVIYTSPGRTASDPLGQMFIDMFKEKFPKIRVLEDKQDRDSDFEANFYVVRETKMPAVLLENMFFDNIEDAKLLYNKTYIEDYTTLVADWLELCLKELNKT